MLEVGLGDVGQIAHVVDKYRHVSAQNVKQSTGKNSVERVADPIPTAASAALARPNTSGAAKSNEANLISTLCSRFSSDCRAAKRCSSRASKNTAEAMRTSPGREQGEEEEEEEEEEKEKEERGGREGGSRE